MNGLDGLFKFAEGPAAGSTTSTVLVLIRADHAIFLGHFPGRPVVPGVCMVHIANRIADRMYGAPLRISHARSIKFLAPVDPRSTEELRYEMTLTSTGFGRRIDAQALLGGTIVLKLTAELVPR